MGLLRKLLFPVSWVYALVVHIRNYLFDIGFFASKSFRTPTICIGNLSVGGTGKTPMTEYLISILQQDYKVAVLSRGYRRESAGFVLADEQSTVGQLGDEPFQMYRKFGRQNDVGKSGTAVTENSALSDSGVSVAVDADRRNGIRILENKIAPDVILLDDAFQHRKVQYGLSILLTSYGNLYCDDRYLPTGTLRDSKREAKRADIIVVTKCPSDLSDSERMRMVQKLDATPNQSLLFSTLDYGPVRTGTMDGNFSAVTSTSAAVGPSATSSENTIALDTLKDKKITLVTGIADPSPLVAYLDKAGLTFDHLRFKDHHTFTKNELAEINTRKTILTTEKDYVRLQGKVENIYYLPIEHRFLDEDQKNLKECLERFMKKRS